MIANELEVSLVTSSITGPMGRLPSASFIHFLFIFLFFEVLVIFCHFFL